MLTDNEINIIKSYNQKVMYLEKQIAKLVKDKDELMQEMEDLSREYYLYKRIHYNPDFFKMKQQIEADNARNMHTATLNRAIETYGKDMQLNVAIEEFSELVKEICKNKRGRNNIEGIIEEIADCYIMLEQMEIIFGIGSTVIDEAKAKKIARLEKRLAEGKEKA